MKPTDRSISPQISSSTSPMAMITIGAAISDSRSIALMREPKVEGWVRPKYSSRAAVTTKTVASRWRPKTPAPRRSRSSVPLPAPPGPSPGRPTSIPLRSVVLLTSPPCQALHLSHLALRFAARRRRRAIVGPQQGACAIVRRRRAWREVSPVSGASGRDRVRDRARGTRQVLERGRRALVPAALVVFGVVALGDEAQAGVGVGRDDGPAGDVVEVQVQGGQESLQVGILVDGEIGRAGGDVAER